MNAHTTSNSIQAEPFSSFPQFSKLKLSDRERYESLISDFPAISDISFTSLMVWWNALDACAVAMLNDNLVISYWVPGSERFSGFSVVGEKDIDLTICTVFDHMRSQGERPRLVHVPEFVIANIEHSELFTVKPDRAFDEYVYQISKFCSLDTLMGFRRKRVEKFISKVGEDSIAVKSLDLTVEANRRLLKLHATKWQKGSFLNNLAKMEHDGLLISIDKGSALGIENLCLYIDGRLLGYCLYRRASDKRYIVLSYARVSNELPYTIDYIIHRFARWFADRGVEYVNMDSDMGLSSLRAFKVVLGPCAYFRKYTVEPATGLGDDW